MPGSTVTVMASRLKSRTRFRYLLLTMTRAAPTVCPHSDVPPHRVSTGPDSPPPTSSAAATSSPDVQTSHTTGPHPTTNTPPDTFAPAHPTPPTHTHRPHT